MHRMLFYLIVGLRKWERSGFKDFPDVLKVGHHELVRLCAVEGLEAPVHIPSLIKWLKLPVREWGLEDVLEYFPEDALVIDEYGEVSLEAEEFLHIYDVSADKDLEAQLLHVEQGVMKKILSYARDHGLAKDYVRIREFLSRPNHAVITTEELYMFKGKIMNESLRKMFDACYEEVEFIANYRVCPHCGWTLTYHRGEWQCNRGTICHLLADLKDAKHFPETNKNWFRMVPGVQRYVLIPGIAEHQLADRLEKDGYKIDMYPKIDRYDLLVEKDGKSVGLDVKDHHSPFFFARNIVETHEELDVDLYYVIPDARRREGDSGYKEIAIGELKALGRDDIRVVTEGEVYRRIGEWLK